MSEALSPAPLARTRITMWRQALATRQAVTAAAQTRYDTSPSPHNEHALELAQDREREAADALELAQDREREAADALHHAERSTAVTANGRDLAAQHRRDIRNGRTTPTSTP